MNDENEEGVSIMVFVLLAIFVLALVGFAMIAIGATL